MAEAELAWLQRTASGLDLVVEFGSWCGRSSVAMASARRLLCVDTWKGSLEHKQTIQSGFDPFGEWLMNTIQYPNIQPIRFDLADKNDVSLMTAAVSFIGGADMVFVDASHDYDSVRRDIETAMKILKPGGMLCGHDYSSGWPGVMRAVDELLPSRCVFCSIWSINK